MYIKPESHGLYGVYIRTWYGRMKRVGEVFSTPGMGLEQKPPVWYGAVRILGLPKRTQKTRESKQTEKFGPDNFYDICCSVESYIINV